MSFDRVIIISLARRRDRRKRLREHLAEISWPFRKPRWFNAIDGDRVPRPSWWVAGGGAWGCMLSHRRVLESALNEGVESLLVLEDDVYFVDGFREKAAAFLAAVSPDWEQLMFGGQYIARGVNGFAKEKVAPGVLRVHGVERTHCYAVRGQFMRDLYLKWSRSSGHCDHIMGPFQHGRRVYAPETFLAGQAGGRSDITGSEKPPERWIEPSRTSTVWLFRSLEAIESVRGRTHHAGYSLTPGKLDKGYVAIRALPRAQQPARLRNWCDMIEREAISRTPECEPAIFDPNPDIPLLEAALGERLQIYDRLQAGSTSLPIRRVYWKAKCGA